MFSKQSQCFLRVFSFEAQMFITGFSNFQLCTIQYNFFYQKIFYFQLRVRIIDLFLIETMTF